MSEPEWLFGREDIYLPSSASPPCLSPSPSPGTVVGVGVVTPSIV